MEEVKESNDSSKPKETVDFNLKAIPIPLWLEFKSYLPKTVTMREALIELINEAVENGRTNKIDIE
jgi:hypothetical protein